ncbi:hypothetical protein GCM10010413_53970 [Promicromonospora sukumoe]|uniref:Putative small integral membrane protein n=1 Tax=Promicromonospora sukumoe TaxID=88382 RepID=A0A7W3PFY0_9MICO|nr:DUF6069 family protein [Promicromonospora sukumoe]MBA8810600.1 putative small integral membrane protein [Promicromonospora sukumoe]
MAQNLVTRSPWPAWTVPFAAAAAAVVVWLIGTALGVDPEARTGAATQPVTVVAAAVAALVAGLAGWGARAVLARLAKGGGEVAWRVLCGVALLVSLLGAASGTTPASVALLVAEHVVVGAVIAVGLRRAGRRATAPAVPAVPA